VPICTSFSTSLLPVYLVCIFPLGRFGLPHLPSAAPSPGRRKQPHLPLHTSAWHTTTASPSGWDFLWAPLRVAYLCRHNTTPSFSHCLLRCASTTPPPPHLRCPTRLPTARLSTAAHAAAPLPWLVCFTAGFLLPKTALLPPHLLQLPPATPASPPVAAGRHMGARLRSGPSCFHTKQSATTPHVRRPPPGMGSLRHLCLTFSYSTGESLGSLSLGGTLRDRQRQTEEGGGRTWGRRNDAAFAKGAAICSLLLLLPVLAAGHDDCLQHLLR